MAAEVETRVGESAGRLRLVPARRGPDDARPAQALSVSAPSVRAVVRFALAQGGRVAASDAPLRDVGDDPQLAAVLSEVGAMPGLRFVHGDEVGRADVVVFTDATLPALASAPSSAPRAVVVLTEHTAAALPLVRACGAVGWAVLPTTSAPLALAAAITAAAQGLTVLTASHANTLLSPESAPERPGANPADDVTRAIALHDGHDAASLRPSPSPTAPALTGRERETLELLSEGLSNKLIARRLRISEHTVKFHISALYAKLGASSRADAVSRAARRGVLLLTGPQATPRA